MSKKVPSVKVVPAFRILGHEVSEVRTDPLMNLPEGLRVYRCSLSEERVHIYVCKGDVVLFMMTVEADTGQGVGYVSEVRVETL